MSTFFLQLTQVLMSRIVAQSISILSYDSCVFEFSLTERKLNHGSICLVSRALFFRRAVRVFSALSLHAYRPHTELFSQGFPTKLRAGTCDMISNGNRTEWSPIRSVIIRVINKIGRPRSGSPICLITS